MNISLVIFSTTMGHKGRMTHKETLRDLSSKISFARFDGGTFAHIKSMDDRVKSEMIKDFNEYGVKSIITPGNLVHHSQDHAAWSKEYYNDVFTMVSQDEIRRTKYFFWLEDDWVLRLKEIDLIAALNRGINFLDKNPNMICVRFLSESELVKDHPEGFFQDYERVDGDIFRQGLKWTKWGPTHPFGPSILRTEQVYGSWRLVIENPRLLDHEHCELVSGRALRLFTTDEKPFCFFDPEKVYAHHIG